MPQRQYNKEQSKVAKANPRVILPIEMQAYQDLASKPEQFREWLDKMIALFPELFPQSIEQGYTLHDMLPASSKLPDVRFRRIKLKAVNAAGDKQVVTICSSDVMPYMTGFTNEVEKALYLRRYGVPFSALTYVFGHNDDFLVSRSHSFGRREIVEQLSRTGAAPFRPAG